MAASLPESGGVAHASPGISPGHIFRNGVRRHAGRRAGEIEGNRRTRVDDRAAFLPTAADLATLTEPARRRVAACLGAGAAGPAMPIAHAVRTEKDLFGSWEWLQLHITGPRAGKTTCLCIRQDPETTGPVLVTSNKRDMVDATRGPRAEHGAVSVNDSQQIIGEPPTWWWNPLNYVTGVAEADDLAALFAASQRPGRHRPDRRILR